MKTNQHYTIKEHRYIEENYLNMTDAELAFFLNRPEHSVLNYRLRMGLKKNGVRREAA